MNWQLKRIFDKILEVHFPSKLKNKNCTFNENELLFIIAEAMQSDKYLKHSKNNGFKIFRKFVEYLMNRAIANFDNMLLLTGDKGTGKSSAGIMFCKEWLRLQGRKWDPNKYMAYTNKQLLKLIDELPPFSPILCDEAINFAASENWNKPDNKELKLKLGVVRTKHLFFILCLPWKITKLDKVYFNSYINYWIELHSRGLGAIFIKDKNPANDPWKIKNFQDLGSYTEFTTPKQIEKILSKHPNFWSLVNIPKVPKTVYTDYLSVRERNVYNDDGIMESVTEKDKILALIVKAFYDNTLKGSSKTIKRLKLHFEEKYDIILTTKQIESVIEDSLMLYEKLKTDGGKI
jgi:hypothetical protein